MYGLYKTIMIIFDGCDSLTVLDSSDFIYFLMQESN